MKTFKHYYLPLFLTAVLVITAGFFWLRVPMAKAAVSLVAHSGASCAGNCTATTSGVDTSGATLLVATVQSLATACTAGGAVTDSKSNTWHSLTQASDLGCTAIWYAYDKSGAALSVGTGHTVSFNSTSYQDVEFFAFSGTLTGSDPLDVQNNNISFGGTIQPGSVTPTQAGDVLVTGIGGNITTFSIDSGFTITDTFPYGSFDGGGGAYFVQTSAAAINPTWTTQGGSTNSAAIAAFKAASGGGGGTTSPTSSVVSITNTFVITKSSFVTIK